MLVIKDAMVLIHLAKATLLEASCSYLGQVVIPQKVHDEVFKGRYPDSIIIREVLIKGKIVVKLVQHKQNLARAKQFNLQGGEAEAVALAWELQADFLATDDDNVRKKKEILQLSVIGTPTIMLRLYQSKKISYEKLLSALQTLRKGGWFSSTVWDKIQMEADKHE